MVRDLMHDPMFLGMKSRQATKDDAEVARDLLDHSRLTAKPA